MGRFVSNKGGFENPPLGNHLGICYKVVDLGLQPASPKFPNSGPQEKVMLYFELPNEKMTDGRPFVCSRILTNSLNEKSNLRPWLVAWRGRDFTPAEADNFDLQTILGKPCMVSIVEKDGKVVIGSVAAVPKGMPIPALTNPKVAFWIAEWDQEVFDGLSEKIQAMIMRSADYAELQRKKAGHDPIDDDTPSPDELEDDSIPF